MIIHFLLLASKGNVQCCNHFALTLFELYVRNVVYIVCFLIDITIQLFILYAKRKLIKNAF